MLCCYITVTLLRKEVIATENVNNEAALQTQQPELISKKSCSQNPAYRTAHCTAGSEWGLSMRNRLSSALTVTAA